MQVPIEGIASLGIIKDVAPASLAPNSSVGAFAWSNGRNVIFRSGQIEKAAGWQPTLGTLIGPPNYAFPIAIGTEIYYWVYTGINFIACTDGTTHTALNADRTGALKHRWTHTTLSDIPILNNGLDVPQYWFPITPTQYTANLPAWPTGMQASILKSYSNFLVAGDVIKSGDRYPNLIKWSHGANVGALPTSWDHTDPTLDAGEYYLTNQDEVIMDLVPMGRNLLIYKTRSVSFMRTVPNISIFSFDNLLEGYGVPSRGCVAKITQGRHCFFTGLDLIVHNGQTTDSVLNDRYRTLIRKKINQAYIERSFVISDFPRHRIILGIPTGADLPDLGIIWDWENNTLTDQELPYCPWISFGSVTGLSATDTWNTDTGTWNTDFTNWNTRPFSFNAQEPLYLRYWPANFFTENGTVQRESVNFTAFVERTGFGVPFNKKNPADISSMKNWQGIWLRALGPTNQKLKVYFGGQENSQEPVTWQSPVDFELGVDIKVHPPEGMISARLLSLRIESSDAFDFAIQGIDLDVDYGGDY